MRKKNVWAEANKNLKILDASEEINRQFYAKHTLRWVKWIVVGVAALLLLAFVVAPRIYNAAIGAYLSAGTRQAAQDAVAEKLSECGLTITSNALARLIPT